MYFNCRKQCTNSAEWPDFVGSPPVPGRDAANMQANQTAGTIFILPDYFSMPGTLMYFYTFFEMANVTVNLQIWRPISSNNSMEDDDDMFELIYQIPVSSNIPNMAVTVPIDSCVPIRSMDRVGFASFYGPSPLSAVYSTGQLDRVIYIRQAAAHGTTMLGFESVRLPYRFSLGAAYDTENTCS
jgi:hypothetical protein